MFTCKVDTYGGMDWHDSCTRTEYIKSSENEFGFDSYKEAKEALINDIIKTFPKHEDLIRKSFDKEECITFPVQIEKEDPLTHKVIKKDPEKIIDENGIVYYENEVTLDPSQMKLKMEYMFGQVNYSSYYKINEVKHPVYAVIENFLAPFKGIPSVERMYHKPFDSVKEASDYIKHTKFHTKTHNVQVYIAVFDLNKVNTEWYENQLQVIDLMGQFKKDMILDNSFRIYPESHIEALKRLQRR